MSHQDAVWLEDTHAFDGFDNTISSTELHAHTEQHSKRGPPKEEWDRNRTLITQLYLKENKTLGEVMQYMDTEKNFIATEKMYKIRIRQWGIDKKFKRREAIAMLVLKNQHQAAGNLPIFTLRGREINLSDLERYARRAKITFREICSIQPDQVYRLAPDLTCQIRPPTPSHPRSPDHLHQAERIIHVMTVYLKGSFDQSICWVDDYAGLVWRDSCEASDVQQLVIHLDSGNEDYRSGRIQDAMTAWRLAFFKSEVFLEIQDPSDWLDYLQIRKMSLKTAPPEIATAWTYHVRALVETRLAKGSPHCSLAKTLCGLNDSDADIALSLLPEIMLSTWKSYLDPVVWSTEKFRLASWFRRVTGDSLTMVNYDVNWAEITRYQPDSREFRMLYLKYCAMLEYLSFSHAAADLIRMRGLLQAIIELTAMLHHELWRVMIRIRVLHESAYLYWRFQQYTLAKAEWEACLKFNQRHRDDHATLTLTDSELYSCYSCMDYISNHSDIADGDQQWRLKIQALGKKWEEELVTAVGDLTLDIAN